MPVQFLPYHKIDLQKWDACISAATNSLIYARSFYLDGMAEKWDALILDNYKAVMPLTSKKKFGISYLYQPAFVQQSGIFFSAPLSNDEQEAFIIKAYAQFRFAEITFNYANNSLVAPHGKITKRLNHTLSLKESYEAIAENYDSIANKNLKRAANSGLSYLPGTDYLSILKLYEEHYSSRLPSFSKHDFSRFGKICGYLFSKNDLIIREVKNVAGELIAGIIVLKDMQRLYNIISFVTKQGKILQANYFMYDQLLREFSGSRFLLDFEGSDVAGIAAFYKHFAPDEEKYPFLKFNRLPWPVKLFKS